MRTWFVALFAVTVIPRNGVGNHVDETTLIDPFETPSWSARSSVMGRLRHHRQTPTSSGDSLYYARPPRLNRPWFGASNPYVPPQPAAREAAVLPDNYVPYSAPGTLPEDLQQVPQAQPQSYGANQVPVTYYPAPEPQSYGGRSELPYRPQQSPYSSQQYPDVPPYHDNRGQLRPIFGQQPFQIPPSYPGNPIPYAPPYSSQNPVPPPPYFQYRGPRPRPDFSLPRSGDASYGFPNPPTRPPQTQAPPVYSPPPPPPRVYTPPPPPPPVYTPPPPPPRVYTPPPPVYTPPPPPLRTTETESIPPEISSTIATPRYEWWRTISTSPPTSSMQRTTVIESTTPRPQSSSPNTPRVPWWQTIPPTASTTPATNPRRPPMTTPSQKLSSIPTPESPEITTEVPYTSPEIPYTTPPEETATTPSTTIVTPRIPWWQTIPPQATTKEQTTQPTRRTTRVGTTVTVSFRMMTKTPTTPTVIPYSTTSGPEIPYTFTGPPETPSTGPPASSPSPSPPEEEKTTTPEQPEATPPEATMTTTEETTTTPNAEISIPPPIPIFPPSVPQETTTTPEKTTPVTPETPPEVIPSTMPPRQTPPAPPQVTVPLEATIPPEASTPPEEEGTIPPEEEETVPPNEEETIPPEEEETTTPLKTTTPPETTTRRTPPSPPPTPETSRLTRPPTTTRPRTTPSTTTVFRVPSETPTRRTTVTPTRPTRPTRPSRPSPTTTVVPPRTRPTPPPPSPPPPPRSSTSRPPTPPQRTPATPATSPPPTTPFVSSMRTMVSFPTKPPTIPPFRMTVNQTDIPNRIIGKAHVICDENGINFSVKTLFPFTGQVFAHDRQRVPECVHSFTRETDVHLLLSYTECGVRNPGKGEKGFANYHLQIVVLFDQNDGSTTMQTFIARCVEQKVQYNKQEDTPRRIEEALEELHLVPTKLEQKAPLPELKMMIVKEVDHHMGDDGKEVEEVDIGQPLRIEWFLRPESDAYGFHVRNCTVTDLLSGAEHLVIDDRGCSTDINIFAHPHYDTYHDRASVHWHAFKVPDSSQLRIRCDFVICSEIKDDKGTTSCGAIPSPPYCPELITSPSNSILFDTSGNFVAKRSIDRGQEQSVHADICLADDGQYCQSSEYRSDRITHINRISDRVCVSRLWLSISTGLGLWTLLLAVVVNAVCAARRRKRQNQGKKEGGKA